LEGVAVRRNFQTLLEQGVRGEQVDELVQHARLLAETPLEEARTG
jgi:hypothetical protein